MPDQVQIVASSVEDAPKDYTVAPNVELTLRAVNASFTDNGAASDWLPAVVLISDSGHVIARAVDQGVKVTAGGDAEVSWFPGVKHAAATTTTTTLPAATATILSVQANFAAGTFAPVIDAFRTNSSGAAVFTVDPLNPYQCIVHESGMYLITGGWSCSALATELRNAVILTAISGGLNFGGTVPQQEMAGQNVVASAQATLMTFSGVLGFNAGDTFYQYFTTTKALSNVGPMGWTIQKVSADIVT